MTQHSCRSPVVWVAACSALTVWLGAFARGAEYSPHRFYFGLDAGVNLMQDFDLTASAPGSSGTGVGQADLGWRMGFTGGYNLHPLLGLEAELGYAYTPFQDADVQLDYAPLLAGVVLRYENRSRFVPYLGIGGGGVASVLTVDENPIFDTDTEVVLAWQAKAGVRYRINNDLSFGIGYKYLGTADQHYKLEGDTRFNLSRIHTHFVGLVLQGRF